MPSPAKKTPDDYRIETFMGATMSSPEDVQRVLRDMLEDVRKDERAKLTKNPRHQEVERCSCGMHEIPAGAGAVSWYWQKHAREACTLELPNARCWCGLLRSEHVEGHGVAPHSDDRPATDAETRADNVRRIRKDFRDARDGTQNEMGQWLHQYRNLVDEMLCDRLRRIEEQVREERSPRKTEVLSGPKLYQACVAHVQREWDERSRGVGHRNVFEAAKALAKFVEDHRAKVDTDREMWLATPAGSFGRKSIQTSQYEELRALACKALGLRFQTLDEVAAEDRDAPKEDDDVL